MENSDEAKVGYAGTNLGRRIMIVEDNTDVANIFQEFLRVSGFDASVQRDTRHVIEIAKTEQFDAFIIEVGIQYMAGIELGRMLRTMPLSKASLLLAVTTLDEWHRKQCLDAGFDGFLSKPVGPSKIIQALQRGPRSF